MTRAGESWVDTAELAARMRAQGTPRLRVPNLLLPEQLREFQRLRDSRWFLVRNRDGLTGERYRCAISYLHNCNALHEFFTYMGVYRPFRGLDRALWGYAQVSNSSELNHSLLQWAPHLAEGHPQLARELAPAEPGADLIAVAIGVLEPISRERAESLITEINSRRPPVRLQM